MDRKQTVNLHLHTVSFALPVVEAGQSDRNQELSAIQVIASEYLSCHVKSEHIMVA